MSKHVVFQPVDLGDDEVKDTVLWSATFHIHPDIEPTLPEEMLALIKNKNSINYPLAYWQKEFTNLGFVLDMDFPYCKEYAWDYIMPDAVRITIQAKDLNTNFNQIIIPKIIARDILNEMKLPMFGKMHPEKFHKKLVQYIDLSQNNSSLVDNIFEALTELEDLCTECISYESFIEWKVS